MYLASVNGDHTHYMYIQATIYYKYVTVIINVLLLATHYI